MLVPRPVRGRVRAAALSVGLLACSGCHDATGEAAGPEYIWRAELAPYSMAGDLWIWHGVPALAAGTLVFVFQAELWGVEASSGVVRWRYPIASREARAPEFITPHGGRVLVADTMAVHAIDAASGIRLWRVPMPEDACGSEGTTDDSTFYTGTRSHRVVALSLADGTERWSRDVGPDWTHLGVVQGISRAGDTLYVALARFLDRNGLARRGVVVALDRRDGRELWRHETPDAGTFTTAPVIAGDRLLLSDSEGRAFVALARADGRLLWRSPTEGDGWAGPTAAPVVSGALVYGAGQDRYAYALRLSDGTRIWRTDTGASNNYVAVCGGHVLVQGQGVTTLHPMTGRSLGLRLSDEEDFTNAGFAIEGRRAFSVGQLAAYAFAC